MPIPASLHDPSGAFLGMLRPRRARMVLGRRYVLGDEYRERRLRRGTLAPAVALWSPA